MSSFKSLRSDTGEVVYFDDFVKRLAKPLPPKEHLNHMVMGVAGEAGELVDCIKKHTIYGKPLDHANLVEELGDLLFYMQGILNEFGIPWQQVVNANVDKLYKRYHEGKYSDKQAQDRADKKGE